MFRVAFPLLFLCLTVFACSSRDTGTGSEEEFAGTGEGVIHGDAFDVIYALQLPIDIAQLFEETGTGFNQDLLLPLDMVQLYDDPDMVALMMGALGVDLSYCKLFERLPESADCYMQIEDLAEKLSLPEEIFRTTHADLEHYINDPESLTLLIEQVYTDVDTHFKSNNQESLASLSLLGGWLEAMYIGIRIFKDKDILLMGDRILQQKFALTSMAGLLSNYQESLLVRRYMHALNKLKEIYEHVEIRYDTEGFEMRPEEYQFHGSVSELIYEPEVLDQICELIVETRNELILKIS